VGDEKRRLAGSSFSDLRSWLGDAIWAEAADSAGPSFVREHLQLAAKIEGLERDVSEARSRGEAEQVAQAEDSLRESVTVRAPVSSVGAAALFSDHEQLLTGSGACRCALQCWSWRTVSRPPRLQLRRRHRRRPLTSPPKSRCSHRLMHLHALSRSPPLQPPLRMTAARSSAPLMQTLSSAAQRSTHRQASRSPLPARSLRRRATSRRSWTWRCAPSCATQPARRSHRLAVPPLSRCSVTHRAARTISRQSTWLRMPRTKAALCHLTGTWMPPSRTPA